MENEIKVGEYIRTKTGYITMFRGKDEESGYYILRDTIENSYGARINYIDKFEIKSHKLNLIDLIEEGDYVNGKRIDAIIEGFLKPEGVGERVLCFEIDFPIEKGLRAYHDCDIESIVTKEMMESITYKVKE